MHLLEGDIWVRCLLKGDFPANNGEADASRDAEVKVTLTATCQDAP